MLQAAPSLDILQSKKTPTKSRHTPTQWAKLIHKHSHAHIVHIFIGLHARPRAHRGSTHLRSLTLADCQPLQTETCQHHRTLSPPWQASPWHPLDHCGATAAAPYISISPLFFLHSLSTRPRNMLQSRTEQGSAHSHTHTHSAHLQTLRKNGASPFCICAVLKWDIAWIGLHFTSV